MSSVAAVGLSHRKYALKRELGTENLLKNIPLVDVLFPLPLIDAPLGLRSPFFSSSLVSSTISAPQNKDQSLTRLLAIYFEHSGEEGGESLHRGREEEIWSDEGFIGFKQ